MESVLILVVTVAAAGAIVWWATSGGLGSGAGSPTVGGMDVAGAVIEPGALEPLDAPSPQDGLLPPDGNGSAAGWTNGETGPAALHPAAAAVPVESVAAPTGGLLRVLRHRRPAATGAFELPEVRHAQSSLSFDPEVELDQRHPLLALVGIVLSVALVGGAIAVGTWFVGHYVNQQIVRLLGQ